MIDRVRLELNRVSKKQVKKRGYDNYKDTFGGEFNFKWFLPIPPMKVLPVEELYH